MYNLMMEKLCSKCKQLKSLDKFYYHRTRRRRMETCKECNSKICLKYQAESGYRKSEKYVFYQRAHQIRYDKGRGKGIEVASDLEDLLAKLWRSQNGICAYTGLAMSLTGYRRNRFAMTVDRINPSKGYIEGNVVLVSSLANRCKQDLTYTEFLEFCRLICSNENKEIDGGGKIMRPIPQELFDEFIDLLAEEKNIKAKLEIARKKIIDEAPPTGVVKATSGKTLQISKQARVDYSDKNLVEVLKDLGLYDKVVKTAVDSTKLKKVRGDARLLMALKDATKENYVFSIVAEHGVAEHGEDKAPDASPTNSDPDWDLS